MTPALSREAEKPLNIRVAEALGCEVLYKPEWDRLNPWFCGCGVREHDGNDSAGRIANYDTDWQDGGPLIEKHVDTLCDDAPQGWRADSKIEQDHNGVPWMVHGPTPLIAVCNLILALKEAGKL